MNENCGNQMEGSQENSFRADVYLKNNIFLTKVIRDHLVKILF